MKKTTVLLLVLLLSVALGDTLDFGRRLIVVTDIESRNVDQLNPDYIKSRALAVLRDATYDRDWTVNAWLTGHDKEEKRLERMTLETRRTNTKFRSDGTITVDYEVPISEYMLEQLMPVAGERRLLGQVACPCCGQEWPEDREVPDGFELVPLEEENPEQHTGILFDARGLELTPALFPRVATEADDEVYGPAFADKEELVANGLAVYYQSQSEAIADGRVGTNPLIIRTLAVTGMQATDLLVSDYEAARVHGTGINVELLRTCRVGFLVD